MRTIAAEQLPRLANVHPQRLIVRELLRRALSHSPILKVDLDQRLPDGVTSPSLAVQSVRRRHQGQNMKSPCTRVLAGATRRRRSSYVEAGVQVSSSPSVHKAILLQAARLILWCVVAQSLSERNRHQLIVDLLGASGNISRVRRWDAALGLRNFVRALAECN
jgi:hypothetical protein